MSGYTMTQAELLYVLPASVTKNTYTTQAVMSAVAGTTQVCEIPPGYFGLMPNPVGRSLYLKALGTIGTTSSPTFSMAVGLDTTAGTLNGSANSTVFAATSVGTTITAFPWHLEMWITCQAFTATTMTLQVNGHWHQENGASGAAANSTALCSGFSASYTSLDPRVTYYPELWGTWGTSNAANTTTLTQMMLFGLN